MFRMYGSRCSHTHWPIVAVSRLDAHVTSFVLPPASDGGPIMFPPTVERVARENRGIAVGLCQHPHVREAEHVAVAIADAAVVLRVVVLEKHYGLVGGHEPQAAGE